MQDNRGIKVTGGDFLSSKCPRCVCGLLFVPFATGTGKRGAHTRYSRFYLTLYACRNYIPRLVISPNALSLCSRVQCWSLIHPHTHTHSDERRFSLSLLISLSPDCYCLRSLLQLLKGFSVTPLGHFPSIYTTLLPYTRICIPTKLLFSNAFSFSLGSIALARFSYASARNYPCTAVLRLSLLSLSLVNRYCTCGTKRAKQLCYQVVVRRQFSNSMGEVVRFVSRVTSFLFFYFIFLLFSGDCFNSLSIIFFSLSQSRLVYKDIFSIGFCNGQ